MSTALTAQDLGYRAEVHLSLALVDPDGRALVHDENLWSSAIERRDELVRQILVVVDNASGGRVHAVDVRLLRGSLDVIVFLGATYLAVSRWKNFVESVELIERQLSNLLARFFGGSVGPYRLAIQSRTLFPQALAQQPESGQTVDHRLTTYLMATNAAMLAVLIGLAVFAVAMRP